MLSLKKVVSVTCFLPQVLGVLSSWEQVALSPVLDQYRGEGDAIFFDDDRAYGVIDERFWSGEFILDPEQFNVTTSFRPIGNAPKLNATATNLVRLVNNGTNHVFALFNEDYFLSWCSTPRDDPTRWLIPGSTDLPDIAIAGLDVKVLQNGTRQWIGVAQDRGTGTYGVSLAEEIQNLFLLNPLEGVVYPETTTHAQKGDNPRLNDVKFGGDLFVLVGKNERSQQATVLTSPDGVTWASPIIAGIEGFESDFGSFSELTKVSYSDGQWAAVGFFGCCLEGRTDRRVPGPLVVTSKDGVNWKRQPFPVGSPSKKFVDIVRLDDVWVAVGEATATGSVDGGWELINNPVLGEKSIDFTGADRFQVGDVTAIVGVAEGDEDIWIAYKTGGCVANSTCPTALPYCNLEDAECKECLADENCGSNQICTNYLCEDEQPVNAAGQLTASYMLFAMLAVAQWS